MGVISLFTAITQLMKKKIESYCPQAMKNGNLGTGFGPITND